MKIVSAKFERKFNLGDYEYKILGLEARVDEGDKGAEVLSALEEDVVAAFTGNPAQQTEVVQPAKPGRKRKPKKGEEENAEPTDGEASASDNEDAHDQDSESENAGNDGESDQDDESSDGEDRDDSDDSSDSGEEGEGDSGDEGGGEPEASPKGKGKKGSKKDGGGKKSGFRKKPQAYDRSVEQHKEIFSGILKSVNPDWKKTEASKLKAKSVSEKMAGKNFLNDDGEVLPEFTAEVKKLLAAKK